MRKLGLLILLVAGCGNNSVTQQSGAAACITASACGVIAGGASSCTQFIAYVNNGEIASRAHISPSQVNCIAAAGSDCIAAKKCLAGNQTPAVCSGSSESCVGNVWQSCNVETGSGGNNGTQIFDCAAYNQMCVVMNGNIDCGYGTCAPGAGMCVGSDGVSSGNFVQSCDGGILHRTDCTRVSASCNPSGVAHCRGNGDACAAPSLTNDTLGCDGSVLLHCLDGQKAREDCSQYNLGCFPRFNGTGFGCFAGNECDPGNYPASCVGKVLKFCNNGKVETADCGAAGFANCNPNFGGSCSN
jgi:hypothetical protein